MPILVVVCSAMDTKLVQQKDMAKMGLMVGIISMVLGYTLLYVIGQLHLL